MIGRNGHGGPAPRRGTGDLDASQSGHAHFGQRHARLEPAGGCDAGVDERGSADRLDANPQPLGVGNDALANRGGALVEIHANLTVEE